MYESETIEWNDVDVKDSVERRDQRDDIQVKDEGTKVYWSSAGLAANPCVSQTAVSCAVSNASQN